MKNIVIAPSLLSADWCRFGEEAKQLVEAGADWLHIDVMDFHYVPNLTFGPELCRALRKFGITVPLDVHLMVEPVDDLIRAFADAGASHISFHPEASYHVDRSLTLIRELGCNAGLALNPSTCPSVLTYLWDKLDMILIMSVNPGFSGQSFIPESIEKINIIKQLKEKSNPSARIAIDGGVDLNNIAQLAEAGADTFISGSTLLKSKDYAHTISMMKEKALKM